MLYMALILFIAVIVAAILGFNGILAAAIGVAKTLSFIFLALLLVSIAAHKFRKI